MKPKFYLLAFILFAGFLFGPTDGYAQTKTAKYVFFFIGDGMGVNQVNGTEMYLAEKEGRIGVKPLTFTQFPYSTIATSYSVYNSVTCSAAAGTALATGVKTKNGTIGMLTTSINTDQATSATFYAHQPSKDLSYERATDLPKFPYRTITSSDSVYNSVTNSAAKGTALATGVKINNRTIRMDSLHNSPLYSIAVKAKKAGKKVGITTSVSIDHATPASFYAHQPDRDMYYEIATDLPKAGFDFYAGSGFLEPNSKANKNAPNIYTLFNKANYTVAKGYEDFKAKESRASKMILMQKDNTDAHSIPYAIDRKPGDLTLSQITESAISFLTKDNKNGFFVMIEGGKIDWACHSNDAATAFNEVVDMDNAVKIAYKFYQKHPNETLIIITADHETGGIVLGNGKYELNLKALKYQKVSETELSEKIKQLRKDKQDNVTWNDIKNILSENLGLWSEVDLSNKQEQQLKEEYVRSFLGKDVKMAESLYSKDEPIAALAKQILNEIAMVSWASGNHSAGYTPVFAIGVGAELFHGKLENTDIPKKIAQAAKY